MQIRVIGEPAFLSKPFATHIAGVRSLARVDAHVSDERIVNGKLALTNLAAVRFLVGVGAVVERQLQGSEARLGVVKL